MNKVVDEIIAERRLMRPIRKKYSGVEIEQLMALVTELGGRLVKNFVLDNENRFVYENAIKWLLDQQFLCVNPGNGKVAEGNLYKGLYIAGNTGSGKSLLMTILAALGNHYHIAYDYDGESISITWADIRTDELCSDFILKGAEVVQKAKNSPIICLNDFGSEPTEQLYMGNRMNIIRQIVEARADKMGMFTLFTSNLPIADKAIDDKYGARVSSRLKQMCNYFILAGKDRRC
jgi:hypothetical protein